MNYLESIVGIKMKVFKNHNRKAPMSIILSILVAIMLSLAFFSSLTVAQETSTLTPVQTETDLSAQEGTTEEVIDINLKDSAVITTTITTTPIAEKPDIEIEADNPESRVCNALANQIINNLEQYPDWQISLNDSNGNVQGLGTMTPSGLELELFNPNARELYLYYFTDEKAITIANSSGLRISLFERDSSGADSRGIIINATIGENREALPINECILPFEKVFPNYTIK